MQESTSAVMQLQLPTFFTATQFKQMHARESQRT